jgi:hypothetical protein
MNKLIPFACLALMAAAAQGAVVGQIKDVDFKLEAQQYHLEPLERQVRSDEYADPYPSGGGVSKHPKRVKIQIS